ncbi:MAG: hypothetical protein QXP43_02170, partial [Nitrososphaerota archaeon]
MSGFSYKVLGEVVLLRLRPGQDEGEALRYVESRHPVVRWVLVYEGIEGPLRRPRVRLIKGEEPVVTVYREAGVEYEIDAANLMLSLGNKFERLRTAATVRTWEVVVDMFAGVGQFTMPIAVHARPVRVHSVEINPDAEEENEQAYAQLVEYVRMAALLIMETLRPAPKPAAPGGRTLH